MKNIEIFLKLAEQSFWERNKRAVIGGGIGTLVAGPIGTVGGAIIGNHLDTKNRMLKQKKQKKQV